MEEEETCITGGLLGPRYLPVAGARLRPGYLLALSGVRVNYEGEEIT